VEVRDEVSAPSYEDAARRAMELTSDLAKRLSTCDEVEATEADCGHANRREFIVYEAVSGNNVIFCEDEDDQLNPIVREVKHGEKWWEKG
jgi:hypothetical protein